MIDYAYDQAYSAAVGDSTSVGDSVVVGEATNTSGIEGAASSLREDDVDLSVAQVVVQYPSAAQVVVQ